MANMKKEAADTAVLRIIANIKQKFAELDALDEQFADLDAEAPMDGMMDSGIGEQFDLLSDKREELETEIRSMRERVQLISEWEKFKGGGWSDEIQSELNSLDQQFANIADGATSDPMGAPPLPPAPLPPEVPGSPELPPTPDIPTDTSSVEPPIAAPEPPIEASAPPVTASKKASIEGYFRQTLKHILDLAEENIPEGGAVSGYAQIAEWAYNALNRPAPPEAEYEKFSSLSIKRPKVWG
jgi:hypothetical protein